MAKEENVSAGWSVRMPLVVFTVVRSVRDLEAQTEAVPVKVRSFLEDFQGMDVRQAKAILQGIIKAAQVFSDGRIELEFRG